MLVNGVLDYGCESIDDSFDFTISKVSIRWTYNGRCVVCDLIARLSYVVVEFNKYYSSNSNY